MPASKIVYDSQPATLVRQRIEPPPLSPLALARSPRFTTSDLSGRPSLSSLSRRLPEAVHKLQRCAGRKGMKRGWKEEKRTQDEPRLLGEREEGRWKVAHREEAAATWIEATRYTDSSAFLRRPTDPTTEMHRTYMAVHPSSVIRTVGLASKRPRAHSYGATRKERTMNALTREPADCMSTPPFINMGTSQRNEKMRLESFWKISDSLEDHCRDWNLRELDRVHLKVLKNWYFRHCYWIMRMLMHFWPV